MTCRSPPARFVSKWRLKYLKMWPHSLSPHSSVCVAHTTHAFAPMHSSEISLEGTVDRFGGEYVWIAPISLPIVDNNWFKTLKFTSYLTEISKSRMNRAHNLSSFESLRFMFCLPLPPLIRPLSECMETGAERNLRRYFRNGEGGATINLHAM